MTSAQETAPKLDVVTIGRCSVDLYGQQIGSRLEDIASFAKSVGGCPANIAIGTARLGLKSAIITRVGDEQMGRYVKEQMAREGVALDGIATDPGAPHLAGPALGRERQDLSADLLPRQLRRLRPRRRRHRRGLHRLLGFGAGDRHAFRQAATAMPPSARPCASPGSMAARSSSTSTTGPISGALPACVRARSATSSPTRCRHISRPSFPTAT